MDASVTQLLKAWSGGNKEALEELTPKVYVELRRMAAKYMQRENAGNTLQATALVHELFLKLVDANSVDWKDKAHFLAVSANIMRRILVDRARQRGCKTWRRRFALESRRCPGARHRVTGPRDGRNRRCARGACKSGSAQGASGCAPLFRWPQRRG